MQAIAISNGYIAGKTHIIWEIPHDKINGYEIYRDGNLIASSLKEENPDMFVQPTMFDHDKHTNLFRKDSTHKLMYIDENVKQYQTYSYKIIAKRLNESNTVVEQIESNTATVQIQ
jgi:hypothetical protein